MRPAEPALAVDRFTMADVPAGAMLCRYFGLDLERPPFPRMEAGTALPAPGPPHVMVPFAALRAGGWSPKDLSVNYPSICVIERLFAPSPARGGGLGRGLSSRVCAVKLPPP